MKGQENVFERVIVINYRSVEDQMLHFICSQ